MSEEPRIQGHCDTHGQFDVLLTPDMEATMASRITAFKTLRTQFHDTLAKISEDTDHPQLAELIGLECDGADGCHDHDKGHHHKTIYLDGEKISLCDSASSKKLAEKLRTALGECNEDHDHTAISALIKQAEEIADKMVEGQVVDVSGLCMSCITANRPHQSLRGSASSVPALSTTLTMRVNTRLLADPSMSRIDAIMAEVGACTGKLCGTVDETTAAGSVGCNDSAKCAADRREKALANANPADEEY